MVGIVAESIKDPVDFAEAVERMRTAGKSLVMLKVGSSELGSAATRAHTGALITSRDAYNRFFDECGVGLVRDYDELVASMECFSLARRMAKPGQVAIAGISGGQTALACDVAADLGVALARFDETTSEKVRSSLPGNSGSNPIDIGATVLVEERKTPEALRAILADEAVGALALLQDSQASLNPKTLENYMRHIPIYAEIGKEAAKPVVLVSPTCEPPHDRIVAELSTAGIPLLRGLRPGLAAIGNLGVGQVGKAGRWAAAHHPDRPFHNCAADALRRELSGLSGTVPFELSSRILHAYELPLVRSLVVRDWTEAKARAHEVGFPMAVKVTSRDIAHRSDVGGVILGIADIPALEEAIATIATNVATAKPDARIDGYELQEQFHADAEAVIGFAATPPFGSLVMIGTGGTLVELQADRATGLAPIEEEEAARLIATTRLGKLLAGYRNLLPVTDTRKLANLIARVSRLAADLGDLVAICDLNPVLIRQGSGEVRLVDSLMLMRDQIAPTPLSGRSSTLSAT